MSDGIQPGQSWECNEARADPDDVPAGHDVPLWEDYPRFTAVVDDVLDGLVELTVATGNSHPRTPTLGTTIDVHVDELEDDDRWRKK